MKILLMHDYGTPTGGAENQILRLRTLLRERGHEVRLFSTSAKLVPGATVEADDTCFGTTGRLQTITQTVNPSAYLRLRELLQKFQPDVVHVRMFLWQLSPLILPLLRPFPAVYQTVTYKSVCPVGTKILPDGSRCGVLAGSVCLKEGCVTPQTWAVLMGQRWLWWRWRDCFDAVAALSESMRTTLLANGLAPVEVIYNGALPRPARGPLATLPVVAFAGRLAPEKGIFVLLDALALLRHQGIEFTFLAAGDGPLREAFLSRIAALNLQRNTVYLGHLTRAKLETEFEQAWVQVVPSLWDEPFGNVATEAMMRGTAAVVSAAGGLAEIVEDGVSGLHVTPGKPEALAAALTTLLASRDLCERMGHAGRERALTKFTEAACVDSFLALYDRIRRKPRYLRTPA